jgi:hypothetical protein
MIPVHIQPAAATLSSMQSCPSRFIFVQPRVQASLGVGREHEPVYGRVRVRADHSVDVPVVRETLFGAAIVYRHVYRAHHPAVGEGEGVATAVPQKIDIGGRAIAAATAGGNVGSHDAAVLEAD